MEYLVDLIPWSDASLYWVVPIQVCFFLLLCALLMWLWNTTLTDLFSFKRVTFWQAIKIMLISALLFGGGSSVVHVTKTISHTDSNNSSSTMNKENGESVTNSNGTRSESSRTLSIGVP